MNEPTASYIWLRSAHTECVLSCNDVALTPQYIKNNETQMEIDIRTIQL